MYQALFYPPTHRSLGTRLGYNVYFCVSHQSSRFARNLLSSSIRHFLLNLLVDDSGLSADTSFDMEHNILFTLGNSHIVTWQWWIQFHNDGMHHAGITSLPTHPSGFTSTKSLMICKHKWKVH